MLILLYMLAFVHQVREGWTDPPRHCAKPENQPLDVWDRDHKAVV